MKYLPVILILMAHLLLPGCGRGGGGSAGVDSSLTAEEARAIAAEAYVYGFPLVMNFKTIHNFSVDEQSPDYKGPFNRLSCDARLFTPQDKTVVTPNSDTPYCMYWLDLRAEPLVLSVPDMDPDRFYHFQFVDLYTHNFAYVGTLSTGNDAGRFLIAGPGWQGRKPEGIVGVIRSETDYVFQVVRTQLLGPDDLDSVRAIQESYDLQPLSAYLGTEAPPAPEAPDFPQWAEGAQFDERMFGYLDFMLTLLKTPGEGEDALWDQLGRLGIGPSGTFDYATLPGHLQDALKAGIRDGFGELEQFIEENGGDPLISVKVFGTRDYLTGTARTGFGLESPAILRAVAAHMGLYGNSGAEAIYPTYLVDSDRNPLDASEHAYTLTFEGGKLPPVKAFWSLTMYDGTTQLFIDNPLDRYLLNSSMTDQFEWESDGGLVLHIAKESPGRDLEANWLPAPAGPFYMVLRLYGPEVEALEGTWTPPALRIAY